MKTQVKRAFKSYSFFATFSFFQPKIHVCSRYLNPHFKIKAPSFCQEYPNPQKDKKTQCRFLPQSLRTDVKDAPPVISIDRFGLYLLTEFFLNFLLNLYMPLWLQVKKCNLDTFTYALPMVKLSIRFLLSPPSRPAPTPQTNKNLLFCRNLFPLAERG